MFCNMIKVSVQIYKKYFTFTKKPPGFFFREVFIVMVIVIG